MTAALAARGPDDESFHIATPVGLGHRRLAVIDVAGGRQPFFGEDGQVAAIVNGEIYNFARLRRLLEDAGHRFRTRSDAEVVAHGYEEWGDGVLDRLEGMFALALWDARDRRLLLARDRMGEKPLYWASLAGGRLAFASELEALRHAPGWQGEVDPAALARYLVYECVPSPATIFRGVSKLPPGALLVARPGQAPTVSTYSDLRFSEVDAIDDVDEGARLLLEELRRSVRERLVSDVPLGVFLSGGIDSSAVAALAAEVRGKNLDTFSVGFEDRDFDESSEGAFVASIIGSRHHQHLVTAASVADALPNLGRVMDEPLGDASIVPTHLLARFARQRVTVALGGDGSDELFAGYPTFTAEAAAAFLDGAPVLSHLGGALARAALRRLPSTGSYLPLEFSIRQFVKGIGATGPRRHQAWMASFLPTEALFALSPEAARAAGDGLYDVIDRRMAACPARDPANRLLYHYAKGYLADDVLTKLDRATMAVGLEARSPFLGENVVKLACRFAPRLRRRGLGTKRVLKRALRGVLPTRTLHRRKRGFAMPIGRWLRGPLRFVVEDTLSEKTLRESGLFEPAPIRRLVREHLEARQDHRKPLWTVIAFLLWQASWRKRA
jgi:asparagine synthase (glutamine-hydrolysing)